MITGSMLEGKFRVRPETGEVFSLDGRAVGHGRNGYRAVRFRGKPIRVHRLIWLWVHGRWPSGDIDHINGAKDDNRIENLREATRSQNITNKKRQVDNSCGFKWVSPFRNKYRAEIKKGNTRVYSSLHPTAEEAYAAACEAARKIHGQFFNAG